MSHVWAFCPPPCSSTIDAGASPHTNTLIRRPSRELDGVAPHGRGENGMPNSAALSWK